MVEKKNPDYSASAENLFNASQVKRLLDKLHAERLTKEGFEAKIEERCPELVDGIGKSKEVIAQIEGQIRDAIDIYGSYQDIEAGDYAVKYRRMTKYYHAEAFKTHYPRFASAVIEETINSKALEGLIKGGLLIADELKEMEVITESPSYAYFVR